MLRPPPPTLSLTITDPLTKYHSLLSTGTLLPDPSQHRLALHLQQIYLRLKDYSPQPEYHTRLAQLTKTLESSPKPSPDPPATPELATESHPIWRNPFLAHFRRSSKDDTSKERLALTRVLTSHDSALSITSPQGLFLSGEVGTGKSMLLDLLFAGLPTRHKARYHFNTFMLHAFSRLEHFRKTQRQIQQGKRGDEPEEYPLLRLAKEIVDQSSILFLDEFQMPDKATSRILGNLLVAFWGLGGVLVVSSNRVPEELERAAGGSFQETGGLLGRVMGLGLAKRRRKGRRKGELFGGTSDFYGFLEVLKARCEFRTLDGGVDWRRADKAVAVSVVKAGKVQGGGAGDAMEETPEDEEGSTKPAKYFLASEPTQEWDAMISELQGGPSTTWQPASLVVYGRTVFIPRQHSGISLWDFSELVHSFGPADYITLASHYHTFIIDHIPILPISMKNEARRFITFLDALYESKCKLFLRAEVGPDGLFFPEMRRTSYSSRETGHGGDADGVYAETIAEVYQDATSPFRPNISSYNPDQDSDFGTEQDEHRKVDFANAGAFTGEDERFAYKRAESRIWEMCGRRWHARTGEWWFPLSAEKRHWEGGEARKPVENMMRVGNTKGDVVRGEVRELEGSVGLERFRVEELRRREHEV